ncbi:MAG: hypothetical protein ABR567_15780 [Myxococcales bacterium]|nr:tetratricopeptide repeat-containing serine/threonine-protein kinase [Myxococcales bacterium]
MTNLHDIIEKCRAAQQRLPPSDAAVLFAAAVRTAAAQGATIRSRLLTIDDSGALHLAQFDDQAPETEPGYLAPELHGADAPRKSEPRVQVYAAGALGFELLTGHRAPGNPAELSGPLGDIVRMALSPDRRERFGDLTQLYDAVEGVQPRPPPEGERNIFNAMRTRFSRVAPEKEALARLIEKVGALEAQIAHLAKAQTRIEAVQRQAAEQLDRFHDGQQRIPSARAPSSGFAPALIAALIAAAAVIGAGWALGMIVVPGHGREAPTAAAVTPPPVPPVEEKKAAVVEEKKAPAVEVDAGSVAIVDAGAADAPVAQAGPADAGAAAEKPARPKRTAEVSQAQLLHAVAISQVRRGESALEKGRADEALESFRAALENEATLAVAFRGMGMAYAMQGNDTQALQAYQRYLQLAPSASDKGDIRRSIAELRTRAKIGSGEK